MRCCGFKISVSVCAAVGFMAFGCGRGGEKQAEDAQESRSEFVEDERGEVARVCDVLSGTIKTEVAPASVSVGESVIVTCSVLECPGVEVEGLAVIVAGQVGVDYVLDEANDTLVRFLKPGEYEVACSFMPGDHGPTHGEAVVVTVYPGNAVEVLTSLDVEEVMAGTPVTVDCSATDELGNVLDGPFRLVVDSVSDVKVVGTTLLATSAGKVAVRCGIGDVVSEVPSWLTVLPGKPLKLHTSLTAQETVAGKPVGVSCTATDRFGNKTTGFPFALHAPQEVDLSGVSLSSIKTGLYKVVCVPQDGNLGEYKLYPATLTVYPESPAKISVELIPDKGVFNVLDSALVTVSVLDVFENLVPGAALKPLELDPPEGVAFEFAPWNVKLLGEGTVGLTVAVDEPSSLKGSATLLVKGDGPLFTVDSPLRGGIVEGAQPVVPVAGMVTSDVAATGTFKVNGEKIQPKDDLTFVHNVTASHGVNLLALEAILPGGSTDTMSRAFAWSDVWHPPPHPGEPEDYLPQVLAIRLPESFIHDDEPASPGVRGDMSSLLEVLLAGIDFKPLLPSPAYVGHHYKLYLRNPHFDHPVVSLKTVAGGLILNAELIDFTADVEAVGICKALSGDPCPSASGSVSVPALGLYGDLEIGLTGGEVETTAKEFHLTAQEVSFDFDTAGLPEGVFGEALTGLFESEVESRLGQEVLPAIQDVIQLVLSSFSPDEYIELPALGEGGERVKVRLESKLSLLQVKADGVEMWYDIRTRVVRKKGIESVGFVRRGAACGEGKIVFPPGPDASLAVHDDLVNQLMFASWWGGGLDVVLEGAALEPIAEELVKHGIEDFSVKLVFLLPPMLSDCNGEGKLRLGIGDLYAQIKGKVAGTGVSAGVFLTGSGECKTKLISSPSGQKLAFEVDELSVFGYEIAYASKDFDFLAALIQDLLESGILAQALARAGSVGLSGVGAPGADLFPLVLGIPAGAKLELNPCSMARGEGYTLISGPLKIVMEL